MKYYDTDGVELDITEFSKGSVVICRVTKDLSKLDGRKKWNWFKEFCKGNEFISKEFSRRGIFLCFCPDWMEFKEFTEESSHDRQGGDDDGA